jgi:hypothetical protein
MNRPARMKRLSTTNDTDAFQIVRRFSTSDILGGGYEQGTMQWDR